jgi:hypothetical protein
LGDSGGFCSHCYPYNSSKNDDLAEEWLSQQQ